MLGTVLSLHLCFFAWVLFLRCCWWQIFPFQKGFFLNLSHELEIDSLAWRQLDLKRLWCRGGDIQTKTVCKKIGLKGRKQNDDFFFSSFSEKDTQRLHCFGSSKTCCQKNANCIALGGFRSDLFHKILWNANTEIHLSTELLMILETNCTNDCLLYACRKSAGDG